VQTIYTFHVQESPIDRMLFVANNIDAKLFNSLLLLHFCACSLTKTGAPLVRHFQTR